MKHIPAKIIVWYFDAYTQYLLDNGLANDSNAISITELIDFVDDQFTEEDRKQYNLPAQLVY